MRVITLILLLASPAFARLGDTRDQAEARYGLPKSEKTAPHQQPLLSGARELTFHFQGFKIRCALLLATDGKEYVVREEYMRHGGIPTIKDFEFAAILEAERSGQAWKEKKIGDVSLDIPKTLQNQLGHMLMGKVFVRPDGAIAVHGLGGFPVRLDLPHALKYEAELKAAKDRKERSNVPKF